MHLDLVIYRYHFLDPVKKEGEQTALYFILLHSNAKIDPELELLHLLHTYTLQAVHYIHWLISYVAMLSVADAQKQQQKRSDCYVAHFWLPNLTTSLVCPRTDAEAESGLSLYAGCQGVTVDRD